MMPSARKTKRRQVLALAAALPFACLAQPRSKVWRVGYLSPFSASSDTVHRDAFRQGLREAGLVEGRNLRIELRYAQGEFGALPRLAKELAALGVDVIVAAPTSAVHAAMKATQTIPIVIAFAGDPVGDGLVASLAKPGGNVTGLSAVVAEMAGKRVEILKRILPRVSRVGFFAEASTVKQAVTGTEEAGRALGLQISSVLVRTPAELDEALAKVPGARYEALIIDISLQHRWKEIAAIALKSRLPTASGAPEFVEVGGLIAYGPNFPDLFRRAAGYVDRILKGAKPAELPVEQPAKFDMVINRATARAIGVTIPDDFIIRADKVID